MRSLFLLVVVLSGLVCPAGASTQVYRLVSAEGPPVRVALNYKLFSKRLAVSCANDTLFLKDYQGTESVKVLQNRFLQITYSVRCGSNCGIQNTAIITVRRRKLQVAILVESAVESVSYATSPAYHYSVALTMPGKSEEPYMLLAQVKEERNVPGNPMENRILSRPVMLHWDESRQVFYSALEPTARCLPVYDNKAKSQVKPGDLWVWRLAGYPLGYDYGLQNTSYCQVLPQWAVGTLPVVRLGNDLSYFVGGMWYQGQDEISGSGGWFVKDYVTR